MKTIVFIIGMFVFFPSMCYSQEYAVDKGSWIISGRFNYSVEGTDLFKSNSDRTTSVKFMPAVEYFVLPNFFIGQRIAYTYSSYRHYYYTHSYNEVKRKFHTNSYSTFAVGPIAGYAFGKAESKLYPYLIAGVLYYNSGSSSDGSNGSTSGTEIIIGGGIMIPAKEHLGILMEAEYQMTNLENDRKKRSSISLNVGIAGLLY